MLTLVEALNYRCLRYISRPLDRFHVLVGPNASGKTTFLDVAAFIRRLLTDGLEVAILEVTPDPRDLLFGQRGEKFEVAVEAEIPQEILGEVPANFEHIRYEVSIGIDPESSEPSILAEAVRFVTPGPVLPRQPSLFPSIPAPPKSLGDRRETGPTKAIVTKNPRSGKDNFYPEIKRGKGGGWVPSFQLGSKRSSFANLPEDETRFPASTWFKEFLTAGIQTLVLDSLRMRLASPPGQPRQFKTDGSNLPHVIEQFKRDDPNQFRDWIAHLQTALPDIVNIKTVERPDTRHRHLVVEYAGQLEIPSWTVSDGTLRLLALTLVAFLPDLEGVFLIEEPENGIHPQAVETVFEALSHVYDAQILLATHSPVILSIAEPRQVLCFAKDEQGATDVVSGDEHPALADWKHDVSLGTLFAAGVLG